MKELAKKLQALVEEDKKMSNDGNVYSYEDYRGVLISANEAQQIVDFFREKGGNK